MVQKMQFLSTWAGYLKTQIPFLTWITLGKSDQFCVLVVSRPWQGALFCCYAVLNRNSDSIGFCLRRASAASTFRFRIHTLDSSQRRTEKSSCLPLFLLVVHPHNVTTLHQMAVCPFSQPVDSKIVRINCCKRSRDISFLYTQHVSNQLATSRRHEFTLDFGVVFLTTRLLLTYQVVRCQVGQLV